LIAFSGKNGVGVFEDKIAANHDTPFNIRISGNQIFSNSSLSIDLAEDGPTPNSPVNPVPDKANLRQNFPVLTASTAVAPASRSISPTGISTSVQGTFH